MNTPARSPEEVLSLKLFVLVAAGTGAFFIAMALLLNLMKA